MTARVALVGRLTMSALLLAVVAWWLDGGAILARLVALDPRWVALALGLSVVQVAVSAWRWRFTAARLGLALSYPRALREYYLAVFLNQVLPGGVAGDVSRAWRHARAGAGGGPAVRAVVLERMSGQVVMTLVATVSAVVLVPRLRVPLPAVWVGAAVVAAVVAGMVWMRRRGGAAGASIDRLIADARNALLARSAWPAQLASSGFVVATYLVTFIIAARAVGVATPLATLAPLVAPVLVAMLVPVGVAGWGVREGAAAVMWSAVGLPAADGVTVSAVYGLLVFASSAPGAAALAFGGRGAPAHPAGARRSSRSNSTSSPS